MPYFGQWSPYVPVARKLAMAHKRAEQVAKREKRQPMPVATKRRKLATSFWGRAWCDNLEAYRDFANRLPRGATYLRNGSVVDLFIKEGEVQAIVAGSKPYSVKIAISPLPKATWRKIKADCSTSIDSLIDLVGGRFSDGVMRRLTEKDSGCFPAPNQINMQCSCPDYSSCCKHIAAVMYGVGCRLDSRPELLFLLRGVDHMELVSHAVSQDNLEHELSGGAANEFSGEDLSEMFGIELETAPRTGRGRATARRKVANRKAAGAKKSSSSVAATTKKPKAASASSKPKAATATRKVKTTRSKSLTAAKGSRKKKTAARKLNAKKG